jgi:hypothetical protein
MYFAPLIAIVFGGVIEEVQAFAVRTRERSVVNATRKTIEDLLKNPNISGAEREELQGQLAELNKIVVQAGVDRVKDRLRSLTR